MLAAPIIHARTKYNDFPYGLLVTPEGFRPQDAKWARTYITQSTRFMELSSNRGRRVVFCNDSFVVTGLSIRIADLYALCGKTPKYDKIGPDRSNFAFIGLVIPKNEVGTAFDVPYSVFLEQYEAYMRLLWEIPYSETGLTAVSAPYTALCLPEAAAVCELPALENENMRIVLDTDYAPLDAICAKITQMAAGMPELGFCSDVPNAVSVISSQFSVVTAKNAQQIIAALEREAQKEEAVPPRNTDKVPSFLHRFRKTKPQETLVRFVAGVTKTWKAIPKAVKIGSLVVIALSSVAGKKKD